MKEAEGEKAASLSLAQLAQLLEYGVWGHCGKQLSFPEETISASH